MSHGKALVSDLIALGIFPNAKRVLALLDRPLVDVTLAHVMQQAGKDDAVAFHLMLETGLQSLHRLPNGKRRLAGVERVTCQTALDIQVVTG